MGLGAGLAAGMPVFAQPSSAVFPQRPVRVLIPVSAGSQTDIVARLLGQRMSENWGQQVLVDNRPGAGGTVAGNMLVSAQPDGHTLMLNSISHAVNASLYAKLPFDTLKDFAGVAQVGSTPNVLVVSPEVPARNLRDLIALAKSRPGQLNFASAGIGTGTHLNGEQFKLAAGIDIVHVPFKGTPEALNDVASNRVQMFFAPLSPALPFVRDRRVLPLAVSTQRRAPALPELPTVAEAGLPGFEFDLWLGILAPSKTPRPVVKLISAEVRRVLELPDVRERMLGQGVDPRYTTPEEFDRFIRSEVDRIAKIVKASGARVE
ncbi:MAG: tripartite tricarboxylate transporter substrate binding protein [Rhodocyclaceae bacterium]|nr:tripartite tricarboxylate transporter substrate binding protein [Rhodocyclaceae bacterium]MCA3075312.1 tripartite tricarboxylate transporter substrate binding protein [Rhodocyclaceae bacterium]MCA3092183.1 tripartite tricarboxylate transporter substrate binding protein [Rhodocyclaceae bacterium]MCA3095369.1 tripartite tricarboxylate transporter substrate binding protein [Rhodocyclaceae bacterium]MCA3096591.1 tripartite tricarboxylate transporter substrate binding protein [Rhodocyclaceae bact